MGSKFDTRRGATVWRTRGQLSIALAVVALNAGTAQATFPGENGPISFSVQEWRLPPCPPPPVPPVPHWCPEDEIVSSRTETVQSSGRSRRVLSALDRGLAGSPVAAWSPNGRVVAFATADRLGTVRRDGTGRRVLPRLTLQDMSPTWSPDGRRLAFVGNRRCRGCSWLYTVRRDGTGLRRVIAHGAASPSWSSTSKIAFVNWDDPARIPGDIPDGLYTVEPDGSRLRRVYAGGYLGPGQAPDWSPDGSRIAFAAATRDAPDDREIFTIRPNGRGLRRLTRFGPHLGAGVGAPHWSPDGSHITFTDNNDLYVMRADGRGLRRILQTPDRDPADARWSTLAGGAWLPRLR